MEELRVICTICILAMACLTDIEGYVISNRLILAGMCIGLIFMLYNFQLAGICLWILGNLTPVLILIFFFKLRVLGAGDIKLLSVIGSIYGPLFAMKCIIASFVAGGILSFFAMFKRKEVKRRLIYAMEYICKIANRKKPVEYIPYSDTYEDNVINFSIAIMLSFMFVFVKWR